MPKVAHRTASSPAPPGRRQRALKRPKGENEPETASPESGQAPQPQAKRARAGLQVVGFGFVFLVLAAYFVWLCVQMGGHSQTGAAPLIAIFAATGAGVAAAGLALAIGGRDRRR
jgi:hypothetical protein